MFTRAIRTRRERKAEGRVGSMQGYDLPGS